MWNFIGNFIFLVIVLSFYAVGNFVVVDEFENRRFGLIAWTVYTAIVISLLMS